MLLINSENQNQLKTNFLAHTLVQTEKNIPMIGIFDFLKHIKKKTG